jgi:hypothetical protein
MDKPLSDGDIRRIMPGVPIIKYSDLRTLNRLPDACIILLEWHHNNGHWVCLFQDDGEACYFNSLGQKYDSDLNCLSRAARVILGESGGEIERLLGGAPCEWNKTKYQADTSETCGRHCINRIRNKTLTAAAYKRKMDVLKRQYGTYDKAMLALIK